VRFESILYSGGTGLDLKEEPPEGFEDLGLDMIVGFLKRSGREEFGIDRLWYSPPTRVEDVLYRQEVFADLEHPGVLDAIREFERDLRGILSTLQYAEEYSSGHQREGIFLGAVLSYCRAVSKLLDSLLNSPIRSSGLLAFREYLKEYVSSEGFRRLRSEADEVASSISSLSFCMDINGSTITVYRDCEGEDYAVFLGEVFERFKPSDGKSGVAEPKWKLSYYRGHVENAILDLVAKIYREPFERLSQFYTENKGFIDPKILRFYREVQFYLSYIDFISPLKRVT